MSKDNPQQPTRPLSLQDRFCTTEHGVKIYPYRYVVDPAYVKGFLERTSDEALAMAVSAQPKLPAPEPA